MQQRRLSTLTLMCAALLMVAGFGGIALGHYAQGGTFSFYKERSAVWQESYRSEAAPLVPGYPSSQPAVLEGSRDGNMQIPNMPDIAQAAPDPLPERYRRSYDYPRQDLEMAATDTETASVSLLGRDRGSWTRPATEASSNADGVRAPSSDQTEDESAQAAVFQQQAVSSAGNQPE